jgi:hypothetical protein
MWDDIELNTDHIPPLKLAFHIGQFVCTLVLWCMEIAVFRAEGSVVNGNVGWTFAVVWPSRIPQHLHGLTHLLAVLPLDTSMDLSRHGPTIPQDTQVRPALCNGHT